MPDAIKIPAPRYFLEYKSQRTTTNRHGDTVPLNKNELVVVDTPHIDELVQYIAEHFCYTHRMLCLHGSGFDKADIVARAAMVLKPWQFSITTQHKHNEDFTAKFCCVGEWIQGGKYTEFLKLRE